MDKDRINDKLFDALLELAAEEDLNRRLDKLDVTESDNFKITDQFEQRIHKLIDGQRRKQRIRKIHRASQKVAVVIAIMLTIFMGSIVTVEAFRNQVFNTVMEWGSNFVRLEHDPDGSSEKDIIRPIYVPNGFEEAGSFETDSILVVYKNNGNEVIYYEQYAKQSRDYTQVDGEFVDFSTIKYKSVEIMLFTSADQKYESIVIWEDKSRVFTLKSLVSTKELIKMAKSVIDQVK